MHGLTTSGDKSKVEVKGLGKVVVAKDITLVNVMLVESPGYNLMSVRALNKMNFDVHFTIDMVVLLRSKTLKVMFVGYVENELFVVDFSGSTNTQAICLFGKADVGWLWHRRLSHVNMRTLQSLHKGGHILGLKDNISFSRVVFVGLVLKERCMILPTQATPSSHQRGYWNFFMLISLVPYRNRVLVGRSIVW